MKNLSILISLFVLSLSTLAQSQVVQEDHLASFNGFQRTKDEFPDSAIQYMEKLTATRPDDAEELMHNSFAQSFIDREEEMVADPAFLEYIKQMNMTVDSVLSLMKESKRSAYVLLDLLSNDSSAVVKNNVYPIEKWVQAKKNARNPDQLLEIGNNYLKYLAGSNDMYAQRKARYGLLIYELMSKDEKLKITADKLFQLIYQNLRDHQIIADSSELSRYSREKRAWYRYMFAFTNFKLAQKSNQNKDDKIAYLKLAYQNSPDIRDKKVSHAYFYDMVFLFEGKEKSSFKEDYLAAIGNDDEKFKILMAMSMDDPSFKIKAKSLYRDPSNFNELWLSEFNKKFQQAPSFSLTQIDGVQYTLGNQKNQWTLVDFWGTWCSPCRKEHPALQKLYQRTKAGEIPKLNIVTIASEDREPTVKAYMKELKYTFPVVMSDNNVEKAYHVSSWPSKFLISPQGKFVIIPFNVDWEKYIEDYIND